MPSTGAFPGLGGGHDAKRIGRYHTMGRSQDGRAPCPILPTRILVTFRANLSLHAFLQFVVKSCLLPRRLLECLRALHCQGQHPDRQGRNSSGVPAHARSLSMWSSHEFGDPRQVLSEHRSQDFTSDVLDAIRAGGSEKSRTRAHRLSARCRNQVAHMLLEIHEACGTRPSHQLLLQS